MHAESGSIEYCSIPATAEQPNSGLAEGENNVP